MTPVRFSIRVTHGLLARSCPGRSARLIARRWPCPC